MSISLLNKLLNYLIHISQDKKGDNLSRKSAIFFKDCVHYCGYKYGSNAYNPYENYINGLKNGTPLSEVRNNFINHLRCYRPKSLEQALGVTNHTENHPLWAFPWNSCVEFYKSNTNGWHSDPNEYVDIMTMFSSKGILDFRIQQEFYWLERAFARLSSEGFQPKKYNTPLNVLELVSKDEGKRYLVLDGNHRISALVALGIEYAEMQVVSTVDERLVNTWKGVKEGKYTINDALLIFKRYFIGNGEPNFACEPAFIISDYLQLHRNFHEQDFD